MKNNQNVSTMNHFTPEQQSKIKELAFNWSEEDRGWYSDAYEDIKRIYFDEDFNQYCLWESYWNDDNQEYDDDFEYFEKLEDLIAYNF